MTSSSSKLVANTRQMVLGQKPHKKTTWPYLTKQKIRNYSSPFSKSSRGSRNPKGILSHRSQGMWQSARHDGGSDQLRLDPIDFTATSLLGLDGSNLKSQLSDGRVLKRQVSKTHRSFWTWTWKHVNPFFRRKQLWFEIDGNRTHQQLSSFKKRTTTI